VKLLQAVKDYFDAINGCEDEGYGLAGDGHAVPKFAHQRFGRVRERFEPRQSEEAAGSFNGVDEPKNIAEHLAVIRLPLKAH
jgi:hypothetical protein